MLKMSSSYFGNSLSLRPNRPIRTFCKHMTSPTVAVRSTVKHDPSLRKQIESIVKLDYVLPPILWVTSGGQTLESTVAYKLRIKYAR